MFQVVEIDRDEWAFTFSEQYEAQSPAMDKVYRYWEADMREMAERDLRRILDVAPWHMEALFVFSLIMDEAGKSLEAYLMSREAVRLGTEALPGNFNWKTSRLSWSVMDNRTYLRACHNLGIWHNRRHETDQALAIYSRLCQVSPEDNLGVRYLMPALWLVKGDVLSVIRHCKQNPETHAPEISYTHALALLMAGETDKARAQLAEAKRDLPLVAKELLKKRHKRPAGSSPGYYTLGGADQAFDYWSRYGKFWTANPKAMELLAEADR